MAADADADANAQAGAPPALDPAELALWQAYAAERSLALRNLLVERHLPLARTVAALLYARRGALQVEFGDYLQFATLGLIEAVDRFDAGRGVGFASFASLRVRGAVLNSLAGLSEHYQQLDLRKRLRQERLDSLRPPAAEPAGPGAAPPGAFERLADIAVGLALAQLLEGSGMLQEAEAAGIGYQQPFYGDAQTRQLRDTLARLVQELPEQERRVVRYHYFQHMAFADIAALMGLTRSRISQVHRQALAQLRRGCQGGGVDRIV